LINFKI
ncbi:hypothetical protein EC902281_4954, partial [Escherichia coli 90.2281]